MSAWSSVRIARSRAACPEPFEKLWQTKVFELLLKRGKIDESLVTQMIARSAGEIAAAMRQRLTGDEPGLLGYWRFDEGQGTMARDLTGNHDGTLVGATWNPTTACDPER